MNAAAQIIPTRKLWSTPGGVHPPEHKDQSLQLPLESIAPPPEVVLPLNQHIGAEAEPIVNVGDSVLKGQLVASAQGHVSANVHASISGTVMAIESRPIAHPSGMQDLCIIIANDYQDQWSEILPCANYRQLHPVEIIDRIQTAGIVGMGGAGFPTSVKLQARQKISTLIINATECEPYITADDMLMRTDSDNIVAACELLDFLLEQPDEILIAIEDNKPEAIACMQSAVNQNGNRRIAVVSLPTKYPSGGERQLIQMLTGHEVISGQLPADLGVICQNVATVVAAYRAVIRGEPLLERIVTVSGEALNKQQNLRIPIGTSIEFVLQQQQLQQDSLSRLVMGGPMMGFTLTDTQVPVVKTTNCVLALSRQESPPPQPAMACIRCGMCAEACPASLLPQQLYWYARAQDHDKLDAYNLFDCIECGACSYACPSHIPLVQYYRAAKAEIRHAEIEKRHSDRARERFEFHKQRVEAEKQARLEAKKQAAEKAKQKAKTKAAPKPLPTEEAGGNEDATKVERNLAAAEDRIKKLRGKLQTAEQEAPNQVPALQARIKEAELKCTTLSAKLAKLKGGDKAKAAVSVAATKASIVEPAPMPTVAASQQQLDQWQQQLRDIQTKISRIDNTDDENIDALRLSEKVLQNKIEAAKVDDNSVQPVARPSDVVDAMNPMQRAMETALANRDSDKN